MPSPNNPLSNVSPGPGKLPVGTVPSSALLNPSSGGGSSLAVEVAWVGDGPWLDTPPTTNPAANVSAQLTKFITDLTSTTAGHSAADKISGTNPTAAAFADGTHVTGVTIQALLENLITLLASTTTNHSGADRLGVTSPTSQIFADGSSATGTTIQSLIGEIISYLGASTGTAAIGSASIPVSFSGAPFSLASGETVSQLTSLLGFVNGQYRIRTVTSASSLDGGGYTDVMVFFNSFSGSFNFTLPSLTSNFAGRRIYLIDSTGYFCTHPVTLVPSGTQTINGQVGNYLMTHAYGRWVLTNDGTNWYTLKESDEDNSRTITDLVGAAALDLSQFLISNIINDGGLYEVITLQPTPFVTGDQVSISGATGTGGFAANGLWTITAIDSEHFTLNGSSFTGTFTGGTAFATQPIRDGLVLFTNTPPSGTEFQLSNPADNVGRRFYILDGDGSLNSVTNTVIALIPHGTETIDGYYSAITPYTLSNTWGRWMVACDGVNWSVFSC